MSSCLDLILLLRFLVLLGLLRGLERSQIMLSPRTIILGYAYVTIGLECRLVRGVIE